MKLDRFRRRLKSGTPEDVRRIARDVGHELPRLRLQLLNRVRAELAGDEPKDAWSEAYLLGVRDVVAAFVAEVEGRVTHVPELQDERNSDEEGS